MAASKSIILLNGIAGFAATSLASLGVFEVGYKLKTTSVLSSGQNNPVYVEDEPQDYAEKIDDLGIPDGCVETCELTAEQLRNLKFEQKSDSSAAYDGLTDGDTFELTIEDSEDSANYPRGKKFILKKKTTTAETVTIRNLKGDEIVLGGDEGGVEIREKEEGGWLEKVPEEVNGLGIPKRCNSEQVTVEAPQTCELTKEQLQKLKFEPKDENTSISIKGQNEGNIVTLRIEDKESDSTNYPQGKKYTLTSTNGTVRIRGTKDGDVVLENGKGVDFREKSGSQLETVENSLGIPKSCSNTCQLTKEQLERLRFETKGNEGISVNGLDGDEKVELKVETVTDPTNYPQGKKYTLKTTASGDVTIQNVKGGDIVLEENGVEIRETKKGGKLEKTPEEVDELGIPKGCNSDQATAPPIQTCQLTKEQLERLKFEQKGNEEIRVDGLNDNETVTLKVETINDPINYPRGKKFTLTSTTGGQVTIWNVKEGGIVLAANGTVVIRETSKGGKLEEVPEEVDKLGIPKRCKVGSSCQLTGEELQRLTFETKTSGGTTVTGLGSNVTVDLKVGNPGDSINYPHNKKYTFTSKSGQVRIGGLKDGEIVLESGNEVVIREKQSGGLLEKVPEEVDKLGIPRRCITSALACELTKEQLLRLKFEAKDNSQIWVTGLGKSDRVTLKVVNPNDKTNYPKERKYTFISKKEGVTINGTKDGDIVLEKDKELLIRETIEGGKLETVVDSLGIPRSCNAEKVKKGSYPQTCELTEELLKNIKFKAHGGKTANAKVDGWIGNIKLTISWTEDSRYPDKKKYSFYITTWSNVDIRITRNGERVTIDKEKESLFKNEGGQLELVEKKEKAQVKTEEANEILEKLGLGSLKLRSSSDFNSFISKKHNRKTADFDNVDDLKKIKFKDLGGGAEDTNPSSLRGNKKIRVSLDWDDDANKFPYNMKFSFQLQNENFLLFDFKKGENSIKILKNLKNAFKVENQGDKWYLVKSS